ncbi:hypothetical protein A0H81_13104 [Grifola frondosa]|uniref:Hydrophobin n=1 Tax=Grifola frondosa TaxID=5627 RepID=A0A1C7LQ29_GRIFR|nr:hypothetical protein A0H81_13104 [Grifola frondosa]
MVHFLSLTIIGTILSAAAGIQAQIDGGILCADPNYSGTCFNIPKACCVDISVLLPTNGVTSFVPLNGSTCQMFTFVK